MGSSSARSSHRPRNVASPRIVGAAVVDKTVVGARGKWSGAPTRFRYAWLRCSRRGRACRRIPHEKHRKYTIRVRDAGQRLSATNFTHYSLLRTTEEILGVPLLGNAATATSMRADFGW